MTERQKRYTPGPWNVDKENAHTGQVATCHGDHEGWYEVWTMEWSDGVDQEANAHLIAAAPELLEALEMLIEWHDKCQDAGHRDHEENAPVCNACSDIVRAKEAIRRAYGDK